MNAGSTLLPCPFCGGKAHWPEPEVNMPYVGCTECGACAQDEVRWNTRPTIVTDEVVEPPLSFAWTATEGYKHYPPYANITGNRIALRGEELFDGEHYHTGPYAALELPPEAMNELRKALAAMPAIVGGE